MNSRICSNQDCSHNGESQELTNFYKDKSNSIGVSYHCKDCNNKNKQSARCVESIPALIGRAIELSKVKSNHENRNNLKIRTLAIKIFKLGLIK